MMSILMSAKNPEGMTLENVLVCLIDEMSEKNKILDAAIDAAVDPKREVIQSAKFNNSMIINKLSDSLEFQENTMAEFNKLGPDTGPRGESRI